MACEVLTVTGAGVTAVNGTYTKVPDESSFQVWLHSSGNYAIVRLGVAGPPGYINIASYPTYAGGPGTSIYYGKTYIPGPTAPACPAGVPLTLGAAGSGDIPTIAEAQVSTEPTFGLPADVIALITSRFGTVANFLRLRNQGQV